MAKSEWGEKRTCQSCGAPFYDLKKKTSSAQNAALPLSPNPRPSQKARRPESSPNLRPSRITMVGVSRSGRLFLFQFI